MVALQWAGHFLGKLEGVQKMPRRTSAGFFSGPLVTGVPENAQPGPGESGVSQVGGPKDGGVMGPNPENGPRGWVGARRVGGPKVGPKGPKGGGLNGGRLDISRFFFSSLAPNFALLCEPRRRRPPERLGGPAEGGWRGGLAEKGPAQGVWRRICPVEGEGSCGVGSGFPPEGGSAGGSPADGWEFAGGGIRGPLQSRWGSEKAIRVQKKKPKGSRKKRGP